MHRKKPDVDVVNDVLLACKEAYPNSVFINSLYMQYHERGGLSKKQLQGLFAKAQKVSGIPAARLATLEAVILKKPTRYKSEKPAPVVEEKKDETTGQYITEILEQYPQHKRVLFFRLKYENNEPFSIAEKDELKKFYALLKKPRQ
ncbi:MAG: hypothetical protein JNM68_16385 [Dinghuibacter sp.]|nr:hypothetical protein [Dinghuibacter sp.]